jgi:DNA-directed RNA polymerase specialized sigma24 family protein
MGYGSQLWTVVTALEAPPARASDPAWIAERALTVARRTALGVLGDREAAADVAQEVAVTAVRKAPTLREPAALDAWLHRIAVRAALAEAHVERRGEPQADTLAGALALLHGLPARQRAALTLRYVHDLPDDAIAQALGCRPGTVRSLLSRGRDALRAAHTPDSETPR